MGQYHHVEKGNKARHQLLVGGGSMGGGILRIKLSLSANPPVSFDLPFVECQINWLHRTRQSQCNSSCQLGYQDRQLHFASGWRALAWKELVQGQCGALALSDQVWKESWILKDLNGFLEEH